MAYARPKVWREIGCGWTAWRFSYTTGRTLIVSRSYGTEAKAIAALRVALDGGLAAAVDG